MKTEPAWTGSIEHRYDPSTADFESADLTSAEGTPHRNVYDKYSTRNPVERRLMEGFFDALSASMRGLAPDRILEVGAGEGEVTTRVMARFPGVPVLCMDLPDDETAQHWQKRDLVGGFGDIHDLPFPDSSFDLVLAIEVLEHVDDPEKALAEMERVTRDTVVVSVPREPVWRAANMARGKYLRDLGNTPGHVNHWGSDAFRRMVARHLDVVWDAKPFPWTMVRATRR
ncbi:MAG: class I SAM-dependent methyltransferase [Actinomycetia bacterium]|nr:class I SAM-dependent methyltransferase [Actinomycetes bacterium]